MTSRGIVDRPPTAEVERTAKVATRPIRRRIWLESGAVDVPVYIMTRMARGEIIEGPAIVELPGSTLLLRPAFSAGIDSGGNLLAFVTQRRDFAELLAR
jgi:N-methylhydantoinase A